MLSFSFKLKMHENLYVGLLGSFQRFLPRSDLSWIKAVKASREG